MVKARDVPELLLLAARWGGSFLFMRVLAPVEVILNALSPALGAVAGACFLGERFTLQKALGLALGLGGVVVVAGGIQAQSGHPGVACHLRCPVGGAVPR